MKKDLFTDGISHIDVDAVERLLQIEQDMQDRQKRQRRTRLLIIPAAALLALLVCMTAVIIPFIPRTLDIEYESSKGLPENFWVYYVNDKGAQKREYVSMPRGADNVFASWKHLNTVGDEVQLLGYTVTTEPMAGATVVPDTLWESLLQMLGKTGEQTVVTATLSAQITSYENYDALIDSLTQTLAKYAGVDVEQVRILIDGASDSAVSGPWKFSYKTSHVITQPGTDITVTIRMTNVSSEDVTYQDSWLPSAILIMDNTAIITHEEIFMLDEYDCVFVPGESREITYTFPIPEDALTGSYDLIVSFGEHSVTFEKAIAIIGNPDSAGFGYSMKEFEKFMQESGFADASYTGAAKIFSEYKYQGEDVQNLMQILSYEMLDGGFGQEGEGELFSSYIYSPGERKEGKSFSALFIGKQLPDGMVLPHGITPEDTLTEALCKMGMNQATALALIEGKTTLTLASDNTNKLAYNVNEQAGRVAISYQISDTSYVSDDILETTVRSLGLEFSLQGKFIQFNIGVTTKLSAPSKYSGTVKFTRYYDHRVYSVNWEFDKEQTDWFLDVVNNGTWVDGTPIYTDFKSVPIIRVGNTSLMLIEGFLMDRGTYMELSGEQVMKLREIAKGFPFHYSGPVSVASSSLPDTPTYELTTEEVDQLLIILNSGTWQKGSLNLEHEYTVTVQTTLFGYSSSQGIFSDGERFLLLSEQERKFVNSIVTRSSYQPQFSSIVPNTSVEYTIPPGVAKSLLQALNNAPWKYVVDHIELNPDLEFDCNGTVISYTDGVFHTDNYYAYADSYTRDCLETLRLAVEKFSSLQYTAIVYFEGEYYGYHAEIDRTQGFDDVECSQLKACANVVAIRADLDVNALLNAQCYLIQAENGKTILHTSDAALTDFEKFTEIAPDFSKETGMPQVHAAHGYAPTYQLTEQEAQTLRDIQARLDYHSKDSYEVLVEPGNRVFDTVFVVSGYKVYYDDGNRLIAIGNWQATISEQDKSTLSGIFSKYVPGA